MKKKVNNITSLGWKFYIVLFVISAFFIVLYIVDQTTNVLAKYVINASKIIIEIFSFGLLPAVFLAFLTDYANTKRHKKRYSNYSNFNDSILKEECDALTSFILDSVNSPNYGENDEIKNFVGWFNYVKNKKGDSEILNFMEHVNDIKYTAVKCRKFHEEFNDIADQKEQIERIKKIDELIKSCSIRRKSIIKNDDGEKISINYFPERFQNAVLDLFPELEESYTKPYNSYTHIKDCK